MSQRREVSRRLDVEAIGAAWVFDVRGQDVARVAMSGHGAVPAAAVFTLYGVLGGQEKALNKTLTPAAPCSDEVSVSTFDELLARCTTAEASALEVVLTCLSAKTVSSGLSAGLG